MPPPARIASYLVEDGVKHLRFRLGRPILLLSFCSCLRIEAGHRQGQKCIPEQEETCQLPQRIAGGAVYTHTCVYSTLSDHIQASTIHKNPRTSARSPARSTPAPPPAPLHFPHRYRRRRPPRRALVGAAAGFRPVHTSAKPHAHTQIADDISGRLIAREKSTHANMTI